MTTLKIGDRVMGGDGDTFDIGTIHGIDGDMADVGWESGQRTPAHLGDLEPYDAEKAGEQLVSMYRASADPVSLLRSRVARVSR